MTDDSHDHSRDHEALARAGRAFFETMTTALDEGLCPGCASRAALACILRAMTDALDSEEDAREWIANAIEGDDADRPSLH